MDIISTFLPGDPRLIEQIVYELKSQGIFDQFRRECIADVDTKPAYQNLSQRVESSVMNFLNKQAFTEELNKNQLREQLRKNITESGFLESGVERIVDQVVNPKINSIFLPKVEDVVYKFLGVERPTTEPPKEEPKVQDLLPQDLEVVSPESVHETSAEMPKEEDTNDSSNTKTEDESPPFEPLDENDKSQDKTEEKVDVLNEVSMESNGKVSTSDDDTKMEICESSMEGSDKVENEIQEDSLLSDKDEVKQSDKDEVRQSDKDEVKQSDKDEVKQSDVEQEGKKSDKEEVKNSDVDESKKSDKVESDKSEIKKSDKEQSKKSDKEKRDDNKKSDSKRSGDKHKSSRSDRDRKDDVKNHSRDKSKDHKSKSSSRHSSSKDKKDATSNDKDKSIRDDLDSSKKASKDKDRKDDKDKGLKNELDPSKKPSKDKDKKDSAIANDKDKVVKDETDSSKKPSKDTITNDKDKHDTKSKDKRDKKSSKDKDKSSRSEKSHKDTNHDKDHVEKKDKSNHKDAGDHKDSNRDAEKKDKHKSDKLDVKSEKKSKDDMKPKSSSKDKEREKSKEGERSSSSKHKSSSTSKDRDKERSSSGKSKDKERSKSASKDDQRKSSSKSASHKKVADDHYSLKPKKNDRRSSDRDSNDGSTSKNSRNSSLGDGNGPAKSSKDFSEVFSGTSSGDSRSPGNTDDAEKPAETQSIKVIKPKFASNIYEAMRVMKIRKQLAKLERQNRLALAQVQLASEGESSEGQEVPPSEKLKELQIQLERSSEEVGGEELKGRDLSMDDFEALEAKLAEEMAKFNANIYGDEDDEDPDVDCGSLAVTSVATPKTPPKKDIKSPPPAETFHVTAETSLEVEQVVQPKKQPKKQSPSRKIKSPSFKKSPSPSAETHKKKRSPKPKSPNPESTKKRSPGPKKQTPSPKIQSPTSDPQSSKTPSLKKRSPSPTKPSPKRQPELVVNISSTDELCVKRKRESTGDVDDNPYKKPKSDIYVHNEDSGVQLDIEEGTLLDDTDLPSIPVTKVDFNENDSKEIQLGVDVEQNLLVTEIHHDSDFLGFASERSENLRLLLKEIDKLEQELSQLRKNSRENIVKALREELSREAPECNPKAMLKLKLIFNELSSCNPVENLVQRNGKKLFLKVEKVQIEIPPKVLMCLEDMGFGEDRYNIFKTPNGLVSKGKRANSKRGKSVSATVEENCRYFEKSEVNDASLKVLHGEIEKLERDVEQLGLQLQNNVPVLKKKAGSRKRKIQSTDSTGSSTSSTDYTPECKKRLLSENQTKTGLVSKRYSTDDLYKPRPVLSTVNRRRSARNNSQ